MSAEKFLKELECLLKLERERIDREMVEYDPFLLGQRSQAYEIWKMIQIYKRETLKKESL